ncbi:uncharacterized aarF domain-containing protein kinase 5-like [Onychostruthus taczanowskii]|uniref:uncharacterized aarF domain-containing protein kinase 5-like n=1 Tax=Onychostruthus taczanowskii TaxID=356909 RepID=UPI001B801F83|nr:uncharacterized aarF domain-containing protein kinase 5-like [Onychostruthus taczanowskii]
MLLQRPLSRHSHLLNPPGAHLDSPVTHVDSPGAHLDPPGAHLDPPGAHLDPPGAHLRGGAEGQLSAAERGYMQSMAARRFPQVLQVLRAPPPPMLLVFRNINTVRSVHAALGAPADRYGIMARR